MIVNTIVQDLKQPSFFFSYGGMNVSMVTPKMCFTLSYIDVISNCSFDKNAFAENIAQSLITVDDLEALLKIDIRHPLFDYELFKLIYHVYIDTEKTYSTQIEIFLLEAMLEVQKIMFKTLDIVGRGHSTVYYLTHKELVSSENVYNDLISTCINNLRLFIANISKDETTKIDLKKFNTMVSTTVEGLEKAYKKISQIAIKQKIAEILTFIAEKMENSTLLKSNENLSRNLTKNVDSLTKDMRRNQTFFQKVAMSEVENLRQNQLVTIFRQNILLAH